MTGADRSTRRVIRAVVVGLFVASVATLAASLASARPAATNTHVLVATAAINNAILFDTAAKHALSAGKRKPTKRVWKAVNRDLDGKGKSARTSLQTALKQAASAKAAGELKASAALILKNRLTTAIGFNRDATRAAKKKSVKSVKSFAGKALTNERKSLSTLQVATTAKASFTVSVANVIGANPTTVNACETVTVNETSEDVVPKGTIEMIREKATAPDTQTLAFSRVGAGVYVGSNRFTVAPVLGAYTYNGAANVTVNGVSRTEGLQFDLTENTITPSAACPMPSVGYQVSEPTVLGFDGSHLWIGDPNGGYTEAGTDGSWMRSLYYDPLGASGAAYDGTHLWLAFRDDPIVDEINTSDGSVVKSLNGDSGTYNFDDASDILFDGTHLWVVSGSGLLELNVSDGSVVRRLSTGVFLNAGLDHVAFDGSHIWVDSAYNQKVIELNASDGSVVRTLSGPPYGFSTPEDIAYAGGHIWVANYGGASVTEIDPGNGSLVQTLSGGSYGFNGPAPLASDGSHLWVGNSANNSVTELNLSDGSWVRTLTAAAYGFNRIADILFDGHFIWVANNGAKTVTKIDPSDGSRIHTPLDP